MFIIGGEGWNFSRFKGYRADFSESLADLTRSTHDKLNPKHPNCVFQKPYLYMSYSLKTSKGVILGIRYGTTTGIKGNTSSLAYRSYGTLLLLEIHAFQFRV